jgi:hypothetical protein
MLIVDEGHEYKNGDSAQGQAMGVRQGSFHPNRLTI